MDSSNESCNDILPEHAVQAAFAEAGVGLEVTGHGVVKLVNQRKPKGEENKGKEGGQSNISPPKRGGLQRNDSLKLLDVFNPSEELKSSRQKRSMRFRNHKLCESGEFDVQIKRDPLVTQSDHGPAALSSYWMANETPSDSFYESINSIDTTSVLSSFGHESSIAYEDESDGEGTVVTKVAKEGLSTEDAAQFDGQGSFTVYHPASEEDGEQVNPSKVDKRSGRRSSKSERNSRKTSRTSRTRRDSTSLTRRRSTSRTRRDSTTRTSRRSTSRTRRGSSSQRVKRRSSHSEKLHQSSPNVLNQVEHKHNDGGATHRRKKKPVRRQRSKSLTAAQPQILKPKTRGDESSKRCISRDRLRALSRRASMDAGAASRKHSSSGVLSTEVEGSRRLQKRSSTRHEEDKNTSSRAPRRSRSTAEGSRHLHRSFTKDEEGVGGSLQPLQRSHTVTGAGSSLGKPLLVNPGGVLRRSNTDTNSGARRPTRSKSIDGMEPAGGALRQSKESRRPRRRGSVGVVSSIGQDDHRKSDTESHSSRSRNSDGVLRRSNTDTSAGARRPTRSKSSDGMGPTGGTLRQSAESRRPHRRGSTGVVSSIGQEDCGKWDAESHSTCSTAAESHSTRSRNSTESHSSRSRHSDGFDQLSSSVRRMKIVDALDSISKNPVVQIPESTVHDAVEYHTACQSSGVTRRERRSSMGAIGTNGAGSECPSSGLARREKRRPSMGVNPVSEPTATGFGAGNQSSGLGRREKRRSSMSAAGTSYGAGSEYPSSGVGRREKRRSSMGMNPESYDAGCHQARSQSSGSGKREKRRPSMGKNTVKEPLVKDYDAGRHNSEQQSSRAGRREKFKRRFSTH